MAVQWTKVAKTSTSVSVCESALAARCTGHGCPFSMHHPPLLGLGIAGWTHEQMAPSPHQRPITKPNHTNQIKAVFRFAWAIPAKPGPPKPAHALSPPVASALGISATGGGVAAIRRNATLDSPPPSHSTDDLQAMGVTALQGRGARGCRRVGTGVR